MSYCDVYSKEETETMERNFLKGLSWRYSTHTPYQVGYSILALLVPHVSLPEDTRGASSLMRSSMRPNMPSVTTTPTSSRIMETYEFDQESIITMTK